MDRTTLDQLRIDRKKTASGGPSAAVVLLALVVVAAVIVIVWWISRPGALPVRTVAARESASTGGDRTLLNASGYVAARRQATVSSKVTGKVIEVSVEEGMKVDAGQVLAKLDSSNVEKSLKLAEAQLEAARQTLGETRANLDRAASELERRTAAAGAISKIELERADAEAKAMRARLARQQADVTVSEQELALWKQQLDDTIIRAPFAGIVTSKDSQPGEMISPVSAGGGFTRTGICTIVDMASLEIEVDVSESYINRVYSNQPVIATLDAYPDWRIPARVIAIIPTADRQKATVKVRVGFEKLDPKILPDMSVKVAFQSTSDGKAIDHSVIVPRAAIRQVDGRDVVWIVRDNKVERRAVTVGLATGDQVTLAAGVSSGERVITDGADKVSEGMRVKEADR